MLAEGQPGDVMLVQLTVERSGPEGVTLRPIVQRDGYADQVLVPATLRNVGETLKVYVRGSP